MHERIALQHRNNLHKLSLHEGTFVSASPENVLVDYYDTWRKH